MTDTGVYRVTPTPGFSFLVNCEMDSEGLPWTVIQNRQSADVDFYRVWDQYKHGFGNISGNFWLGNDNIFILTRNSCALRIDMQSLNGTFGYAEYSHFQIANETERYKLSISGFTGKFRDSFRVHHGYKFSTLDRDNDKDPDRSCAEGRGGAWWYRHCADVNLNGMYNPPTWRKGIYWQGFYNDSESVAMKTTKMAVKC
ncbi:ryncolin-1-like [Argopecten irradians]|uniref:ryncolin-1-like n=1 Tax=Argopecten irradians TaxID=31199 RepID=UPI0037215B2A